MGTTTTTGRQSRMNNTVTSPNSRTLGTTINGTHYQYLDLNEETQTTIQKLIEQGRWEEVNALLSKYNVSYERRPGDVWNKLWGFATSEDIQREQDKRDIADALLQMTTQNREERVNSAQSQKEQMQAAGYNTDLTGGVNPGQASEFNEPEAGTPLVNTDTNLIGRQMETVASVASLTQSIFGIAGNVANTMNMFAKDNMETFLKGLDIGQNNPSVFYDWDTTTNNFQLKQESEFEGLKNLIGNRRYKAFLEGLTNGRDTINAKTKEYKDLKDFFEQRAETTITGYSWKGALRGTFEVIAKALGDYETEMARYTGENGFRNWKIEQESTYMGNKDDYNTSTFHAGVMAKATPADMQTAWDSQRGEWEQSKADTAEAKMWNDILKGIDESNKIDSTWKPILKSLVLFMKGQGANLMNRGIDLATKKR